MTTLSGKYMQNHEFDLRLVFMKGEPESEEIFSPLSADACLRKGFPAIVLN